MTAEYFDVEQRSPEWYELRLGLPTASKFATVMASGRSTGSPSITRRKYMHTLAGERMTGEPAETYTNHHMDRGREMEEEALANYALQTGADPARIGFVRDLELAGGVGCSPDALVGDDGMVEIKTALPHLLIDALIGEDAPHATHEKQLQGNLWITGRAWCDLVVYWPRLPLFVKRVHASEQWAGDLSRALERFNAELASIVAWLEERRAGGDGPAPATDVDLTTAAPAV